MKKEKTYQITCTVCGKKTSKRSSRAQYCGQGCKQRAYEIRKGIGAPEFIKKKKGTGIRKVTTSIPTAENKFIQSVRVPALSEIEALKVEKQKLMTSFSIIAKRNIKEERNFWSLVVGFAAGATLIKRDDPMLDLFVKLVGVPALFQYVGTGMLSNRDFSQAEIQKARKLERIKSDIEIIDNKINALEIGAKNAEIESKKHRMYEVSKNIISATEYRKKIIPELKFNEHFRYLMGNPSENFYALITGAPGSGKSTFTIQFANYFKENHGDVLFLASEQSGENKPLQNLLRKYKADFDIEQEPNKLNDKQLIKLINHYQLVIIDSANHMGLSSEQLENLRENASKTAFLVVLQTNKDGDFKGDQTLKHNCDIFMKVDDMIVYQEKSRFSPPAHVHIIH